jgi:hypothetical protein
MVPTPNPLSSVDLEGLNLVVKTLEAHVNQLTGQVNQLRSQLKSITDWADQLASNLNSGPLNALDVDENGNLVVSSNVHIANGRDIILDT